MVICTFVPFLVVRVWCSMRDGLYFVVHGLFIRVFACWPMLSYPCFVICVLWTVLSGLYSDIETFVLQMLVV